MLAGLKSTSRLLHPGLGLKRWLVFLFLGFMILGLGVGLFLREFYTDATHPLVLQLLLLQSWPRWLRGVLLVTVGGGLAGYSLFQLNKLFLEVFLPNQASVSYIADQVYYRRRRRGGPKVVAIGGGTGLSVLLRGLKHHTDNITAIVTVADDGGSSGKLRREFGVLPPGDFRNCIAALADDEALMTQLFQYRFRTGGLDGHSFGNIFITAMAEVTGSFEKALLESGRVLNIRGSILPSTLENVTLFAEVDEGPQTRKVQGESAIPEAKLPIERVYLQPDTVRAFPAAVQALLNADLIIAGPGSLYTSIIPNLLVAEIVTAIRASTALKIYICNVATQPGETDGYALDDYVQAIESHTRMIVDDAPDLFHLPANLPFIPRKNRYLFEHVLANGNYKHPIPPAMSHLQPVPPELPPDQGYKIIAADVVDEQYPWRHDAIKLSNALMSWYGKIKQQD